MKIKIKTRSLTPTTSAKKKQVFICIAPDWPSDQRPWIRGLIKALSPERYSLLLGNTPSDAYLRTVMSSLKFQHRTLDRYMDGHADLRALALTERAVKEADLVWVFWDGVSGATGHIIKMAVDAGKLQTVLSCRR